MLEYSYINSENNAKFISYSKKFIKSEKLSLNSELQNLIYKKMHFKTNLESQFLGS